MRALEKETLSKALDSLKNTENGILEKGEVSLSSEARVLVVGLGGMGIKTLARLKRELIKRVGNINEEQVAFLAIDTSWIDLDHAVEKNELERHETCHLRGSIYTQMGRLTADDDRLPISIRDIVDEREGFNATVDGLGAGQNRLSGRLTIMDPANRQKLSDRVLDKIKKFKSFIDKDLNIYVVAGIGGGTGSGLCIDVPYLLRDVAKRAGLPENKVKVFGHIYLPNAYEYGYGMERVYNRNGYAALKEIDYYMNISELGEEYRVLTPFGSLTFEKNIFDTCTLIGGKSYNKSMFFEDPKEAAIKTCVHSLINRVMEMNTEYWHGRQYYNLETCLHEHSYRLPFYLNNIIGDPDNPANFTSGNASYKYSCVGAASVTFPAEAIADQYIGSVFDKVWGHWTSNAANVTKKDIDDFEKNIAEPYFLVKKAVLNFEDKFEEQAATFTFNRRTIDDFEPMIISIMESEIKKFYVNIESTLDLLREKAKKVFTDPNKGPLVLAKILDDVEWNGYLKRVECYVRECEKLKLDLFEEVSQYSVNVKLSRVDLVNHIFLYGRKVNVYCKNLKELYKAKLKQTLFEKLFQDYYKRNAATGAYRQIEKMLREDFVSYIDVLEYIHDILKDNVTSSSSALTIATKDPDSILRIGASSLDKLKETLTDSIRKKIDNFDSEKMYQFIGALTSDMLDEETREEWVVQEDIKSKCAKTFRRFIKSYPDEDFQSVMNSTFASYMDEAYSLSNSSEKTAVAKDIFTHLEGKSAPMFNTWKGNELDGLNGLSYKLMMFPSNMGQWEPIFRKVLPANTENNMFFSTDQNTIYNYTIYSRLPIWLHADIADYEWAYNEHYMTMGLHINESSKVNYRKFPSLFIPEQWWRYEQVKGAPYTDKNELKHRADIRRVFDKALEMGIVQKTGTDYDIQVIGDVDSKPTIEQIDQFIMGYMSDPSNLREDGTCKMGRTLLVALQAKFGGKKVMINQYQIGVETYPTNNDEEAFLLLRRQMSRVEILEKETKYFEAVCNYIKK